MRKCFKISRVELEFISDMVKDCLLVLEGIEWKSKDNANKVYYLEPYFPESFDIYVKVSGCIESLNFMEYLLNKYREHIKSMLIFTYL